jgi:hypothetical protein
MSQSLLASAAAPHATSKHKTIELHNPSHVVEFKSTGTLTFKWSFSWEESVREDHFGAFALFCLTCVPVDSDTLLSGNANHVTLFANQIQLSSSQSGKRFKRDPSPPLFKYYITISIGSSIPARHSLMLCELQSCERTGLTSRTAKAWRSLSSRRSSLYKI